MIVWYSVAKWSDMAMIGLLCADCTVRTWYLHIVDLWLLYYACNGTNV